MALAAVVAVDVVCHESTRGAHRVRALLAHLRDLATVIHAVGLHDGELHVLVLVLDTLRLGVVLLLALLTPTTKTKDQVKSGFLLDIVVTKSAAVFQLLAGKNQTLLIRRNTFLILDLSLNIINGICIVVYIDLIYE